MADITITIGNTVTAAGLLTGRHWLSALVGRTGGGATKLDGLNPALYGTGAIVMFLDVALGELHYVKDAATVAEDDPVVIVPDSGAGHWRKVL